MRKEVRVCNYVITTHNQFLTQRQVFTAFGNEVLAQLTATHLEKKENDHPYLIHYSNQMIRRKVVRMRRRADIPAFPFASAQSVMESNAILGLCRMDFEQYLTSLPKYDFALTYGSGVFRQKGYSEKDKKNAMLDVIIGVKDPEAWHKENLRKNPKHYSSVRHLGAHSIVKVEVGSRCCGFLSGVWSGSCLLQSSRRISGMLLMRRRWV